MASFPFLDFFIFLKFWWTFMLIFMFVEKSTKVWEVYYTDTRIKKVVITSVFDNFWSNLFSDILFFFYFGVCCYFFCSDFSKRNLKIIILATSNWLLLNPQSSSRTVVKIKSEFLHKNCCQKMQKKFKIYNLCLIHYIAFEFK